MISNSVIPDAIFYVEEQSLREIRRDKANLILKTNGEMKIIYLIVCW